jgi:hypothetical protein
MTPTAIIPIVATLLFVVANVVTALSEKGPPAGTWRLAAAISVVFGVFSVVVIVQEGPTGFWANHTSNLWGNQVWCDLLLAATAGFVFLAPEARARGLSPLPWFVLIAATGSIGLFALVARVLYLREQPASPKLDAVAGLSR